MVDKYTVRTETDQKIPVVAPPAGADVYLIARLWDWWPILELEKGKTYRLHLTSMDYQHGFSLQPENINVQVLPGYEHVLTVTPNRSGVYAIVCNEFCGIGHHKMVVQAVREVGGGEMATTGNMFRICPRSGLQFHKSAEPLIKLNAVAAVVALLVGGVLALLVLLTRWQAVHLIDADNFYLVPDRARSGHAGLLDHLLRDRDPVLLLVDAAAVPAGDTAARPGSRSR